MTVTLPSNFDSELMRDKLDKLQQTGSMFDYINLKESGTMVTTNFPQDMSERDRIITTLSATANASQVAATARPTGSA